MQAKDVPDRPVLEFLTTLSNTWPANWVDLESEKKYDPKYQGHSVLHGMPEGTPRKVALAKMRSLIKRGLVEGCSCGCRGDFKITDDGIKFLRQEQANL